MWLYDGMPNACVEYSSCNTELSAGCLLFRARETKSSERRAITCTWDQSAFGQCVLEPNLRPDWNGGLCLCLATQAQSEARFPLNLLPIILPATGSGVPLSPHICDMPSPLSNGQGKASKLHRLWVPFGQLFRLENSPKPAKKTDATHVFEVRSRSSKEINS